MLPVIKGVIVNVPVVPPNETLVFTSIGGYWNTWNPLPESMKSTCLFRTLSVVSVPPIPTLITLNVSESNFSIWYWFVVLRPAISFSVLEYKTVSPVSNPWFL